MIKKKSFLLPLLFYRFKKKKKSLNYKGFNTTLLLAKSKQEFYWIGKWQMLL